MRIYQNFREALGEIKRDLAEMGVEVKTKTYQNKIIEGDPNFYQKELEGYFYRVTSPDPADLSPTQPWASAELAERLEAGWHGERDYEFFNHLNPGEAWKLRPDVWRQFLLPDGHFDYTYPARYYGQLNRLASLLKADPASRQCHLAVWGDDDLASAGGARRVPCSLGYHFLVRGGALCVTYLQRSADFATHFSNDLWLTHMLQRNLAERVGFPVGSFSHWIGSLHVFAKDVAGVF